MRASEWLLRLTAGVALAGCSESGAGFHPVAVAGSRACEGSLCAEAPLAAAALGPIYIAGPTLVQAYELVEYHSNVPDLGGKPDPCFLVDSRSAYYLQGAWLPADLCSTTGNPYTAAVEGYHDGSLAHTLDVTVHW